jgi:hypothetical protein
MRRHPWADDADKDLGWAIEAASTEFRDHDLPPGNSRGYKSALIASWAIHFWSDPKVQENLPHARTHTGRILGQYIGDLHRDLAAFYNKEPGVVIDQDPDRRLYGTEPYGAKFNGKDARKAMRWVFEDDSAFQTVATAHGLYAAKVLDELAGQTASEAKAEFSAWRTSHPEATRQQLDAKRQDILEDHVTRGAGAAFAYAAQKLSVTSWVITDAANIADIQQAKADDARFADFKKMAESVVGLAPGPSGKFVGLLVDQAKEKIFGKIDSNQENQAREGADTTADVAKNMFIDLTVATMMRHGLFGPTTSPTKAHPYNSKDFSPHAPGHFMVDGKVMSRGEMNADKLEAYDDWLTMPDTGRIFGPADQGVRTGFNDAKKYYSGSGS